MIPPAQICAKKANHKDFGKDALKSLLARLPPGLQIFTDGSSMSTNGPSGSGFVMIDPWTVPLIHNSKYLGNQNILYAEVDAILRASRYLNNNPYEGSNVYFFVDSNTALQLATGWRLPNPLSNHASLITRDSIQLLNQDYMVSFIWVPSHCGIQGNEIADKLAKRGAKGESSYDPPD